MFCNEESETWGVLVCEVTSSIRSGVSPSSELFRFSPYNANCTDESEGWDFGKGEAIFMSLWGVSHVFRPLFFSLRFPSWATLSSGASQVFRVFITTVTVSELVPEGAPLPSRETTLASSVASSETKSADRPKFFSCSDLSSASVCTPLAIRDTKLGDATETVKGPFSPPYPGEGSSWATWPGCEDARGIWVLVSWVPDLWASCSVKLSNRACSWARNWTRAVSSSVRRIRHCARNSLYSTSRVSSS